MEIGCHKEQDFKSGMKKDIAIEKERTEEDLNQWPRKKGQERTAKTQSFQAQIL